MKIVFTPEAEAFLRLECLPKLMAVEAREDELEFKNCPVEEWQNNGELKALLEDLREPDFITCLGLSLETIKDEPWLLYKALRVGMAKYHTDNYQNTTDNDVKDAALGVYLALSKLQVVFLGGYTKETRPAQGRLKTHIRYHQARERERRLQLPENPPPVEVEVDDLAVVLAPARPGAPAVEPSAAAAAAPAPAAAPVPRPMADPPVVKDPSIVVDPPVAAASAPAARPMTDPSIVVDPPVASASAPAPAPTLRYRPTPAQRKASKARAKARMEREAQLQRDAREARAQAQREAQAQRDDEEDQRDTPRRNPSRQARHHRQS